MQHEVYAQQSVYKRAGRETIFLVLGKHKRDRNVWNSEKYCCATKKNCDHFSITHSPFSLAMFWTIGRGVWERKRGFVQFWMIFFAKIIWNTIDFRNFADKFHEDYFLLYDWLSIVNIQKQSSFRLLLKLFLRKKKNCLSRIGVSNICVKLIMNQDIA